LTTTTGASEQAAPFCAIIGAAESRVWGMTSSERLARTFRRVGLEPAGQEAFDADRGMVVADAGWVFDESLIRALAGRPNVVLVDDDDVPAAVHASVNATQAAAELMIAAAVATPPGYARLTALELGSSYNSELRKREPPILRRLTKADVRGVEKRLFQGAYKGVTDLVTKYLWPTPARVVTRWCALAGVTPNQVTFASFLLVVLAFALFWTGHFGWGLAAAWAMTFLDTVDGKLARVTLTSSRIGNFFDHGIDLVHPPFWWWAWLTGVQAAGLLQHEAMLILCVVVGGYVAQRLIEGAFLTLFKVEVHAWRPFDSFFRLITARRNPNLLLLTGASLAGRPDLGMELVAVWTAISLAVHGVQVLQAMATPRGEVTSWLAR